MTIAHVDWKEFKGVVENGLVRANLDKVDVKGSLDLIKQTISEVLEIYVQKRYRDRFRIETSYRMGSYKATLHHELTELCSWSGKLA